MPKITEDLAAKAAPPKTGQRLIFDTETKGFGLRITASGAKAWIAEVHMDGKSKRRVIARVGEMKCAEARREAQALRLAGVRQEDPEAARRTVADLRAACVKEDQTRLAPRTLKEQDGLWRRYIEPKIASKKLRAIATRDIASLLSAVRGDVSANRTHEVLRRMFGYAAKWKWMSENPAIGWERRREVARGTYLEAVEVTALLAALPENAVGDALRLAMLTGARLGEVLSMTRTQVRENGAVWVKPAAGTKQRREHIVPLSVAAQEVIGRQPAHASGLVFAREDGEAIKSVRKTFAWAIKRAGLRRLRVHDLRHSFASLMVNSGASLAVVGAALGHSTPQVTSRYAHLATDTLRSAIESATGNVVPLRRKAAG